MKNLKDVFKKGSKDYTEALGVEESEYETVKKLDVLMQEFVDEALSMNDLDEEKFILKIIHNGVDIDNHFKWLVLGMKISQLKFSIATSIKEHRAKINKETKEA